MNLTLTYVGRFDKTSSAGKPYTSLSLKANEYGDRYISGFGNKENAHWKAGDTIEVDVEEKGQYLNFTMPKSFQKAGAGYQPTPDTNRVEAKVDAVLREQQTLNATMTDIKGVLGQILAKVDPSVI